MKKYTEFIVKIYHTKEVDYAKPYYVTWIREVLNNHSSGRKIIVKKYHPNQQGK